MIKRQPHKIDIGAVFNAPPNRHVQVGNSFAPVSKEIVFDIDLTDYDDIRTCCSGATICNRCWGFMQVAVKALRSILATFGLTRIMWVYSGRRGIHAWVSDDAARALPADARAKLAQALNLNLGGDRAHHMDWRSAISWAPVMSVYETVLYPGFMNICIASANQGILDSEERWAGTLKLIDDATVVDKLNKVWPTRETGEERWQDLLDLVHEHIPMHNPANNPLQVHQVILEIVLHFIYPRLDIEVSKQLNHLLKAPFCIHPKTERVCVPIDPDRVDEFSPELVPTVRELLREFSQWEGSADTPAQDKTSLGPVLNYWRSTFLNDLARDLQSIKQAELEQENIMAANSKRVAMPPPPDRIVGGGHDLDW